MGKTRGYEILILLTYIAMSAVCIYMQFFSKNQTGDLTNLIVNVTMFVIVAAILTSCTFGSLVPTAKITADLIRVTEKIESDAKHSHSYLWEKYSEEKSELFEESRLQKQYRDYQYELERIVHTDKTYYKCDIADYIGYDLIDTVLHRERMNQVAGVMTGLGILGTFVGLSLGLQSFNTGTTAEITNSIAPLMSGIKVAFHTSIYGMVFSLVFNYVYKRRLDDAESAVRGFLSAYKKYVLPDTATDGINRLMELQQQQTEAITKLSQQFTEGLRDIIEPEFEHFDETLDKFARITTRNQMDQLNRIVDVFVAEMNKSLGSAFTNMAKVTNQTLTIQETNHLHMKGILDKNAATAETMNKVSIQMKAMADSLGEYSLQVHALEKEVANEAEILRKQNESSKKILDGAMQYMEALENARNTKQ